MNEKTERENADVCSEDALIQAGISPVGTNLGGLLRSEWVKKISECRKENVVMLLMFPRSMLVPPSRQDDPGKTIMSLLKEIWSLGMKSKSFLAWAKKSNPIGRGRGCVVFSCTQ